jgi:N-acetylmuramoyl-L-alanine amidase
MYQISRIMRLTAAVATLSTAVIAGAAAVPAVTDVRIGDYPSKTRFVLDISERVDYRVFSLVDPYRVVIDLPEVAWRLEGVGTPRGLVAKFRYGLFRRGQSRLVIDAVGPVVVAKNFMLAPSKSNGHRLVLDLRKVTREAALRRVYRPGKTALRLAPVSKRRTVRRSNGGRRTIALDPGHGGVDPGATGRTGSREKHITLAQARELRRQLEATGRYRVVLTRNRDIFVRLRDRIAIAQDAGAELFISLHADSMRDRRVRGGSIYTLSETASDKEAEALAAKENRADLIAGIDLSDQSEVVAKILIDLRQRLTKNDSAVFAKFLLGELGKSMRLLRNNHRFAGFAVLKAPDVPSVLVEMGYLSNRTDERLLKHARHRGKIAAAMVRAVNRYFVTHQARRRP